MRTLDPTNIRADYDTSLADVRTAVASAEDRIADDGPRKLITEYAFVSAATLFEGCVSDLFVAYINRDFERFRSHILGNLELKTDDSFAKRAKSHVTTSIKHLNADEIRNTLDPSQFNVTFATTDKMKESAGKWLAAGDAARFTNLTARQCAVIDFTKRVRNFLAHRSQSADTEMQTALVAIDLPADLKRGQNNVNDVGAFLRAIQNGQPRILHYLDALLDLGQQLCP